MQSLDNLKGRRVILIGGGGFAGHHLALRLKREGAEVGIIDSMMINNYYSLNDEEHADRYRRMCGDRSALLTRAQIPFIQMDARDYDMLSRALTAMAPQVIVQLAAIAHIDRSNKDPHTTWDHSMRTLENALDYARQIPGMHFVYFSSSTAYGDFGAPVLTEDAICNPKGIYGSLKLCGEIMVRAYHETYNMDHTIVRPCALYGPRCVSGRVIQKFIEAALQGKPITVRGTGADKEDFTYVDDLVDGVTRVIANPLSRNETFNITAGQARSLGELAGLVQAHFPNTPIHNVDRDPEKPHRGTMSVDKARRLLGYEPRYQLEDGIEAYVRWFVDFWPYLGELSNAEKPQVESVLS